MTVRELDAMVPADPPFYDDRLFDDGGDNARPDARYMAKLVRHLSPRFIVELGTSRGRTAAQIAAALPIGSRFTTINWPNPPSGDDVGVELLPWRSDPRITLELGDTRDEVWRFTDETIDLLYIDSGTIHEYALVSVEWELYRPKLVDGAVVIADDINDNDMRRWWNPLPYDKCEVWGGSAGMFYFRR